MEHASIAAFARFTLQLLHLGAPADLVQAAIDAQHDEAAHTRPALEIAASFGASVGNLGALDVTHALESMDLESIVVGTVLEGCIGETLAAVEAEHALRQAMNPTIQAALATIAADETRHAELAGKFVKWALQTHPDLRARILEAVRTECGGQHCSIALDEPNVLHRHGYVSGSARARLKQEVLRLVVLPVAEALCAAA